MDLSLVQYAYHCKILVDAGALDSYKSTCGYNRIYSFSIGSLTWEEHGFLDKIRENTMWNKTKFTIKENALPMTTRVIKSVITGLINKNIEGLVS